MKTGSREARARPVDVALLVEGTYPFVRGGVSAWVHQLIEAMPESTFSVVFLGGRRSDHGEPVYPALPNVHELECHYLFEQVAHESASAGSGRPVPPGDIDRLHDLLRTTGPDEPIDTGLLRRLTSVLVEDGGRVRHDFLLGDETWQRICDAHRRDCPESSFADWFWTVRAVHAALFELARVARSLPPARVYHSLSTGYAGLLGALLHHRHDRPFVLTEHGVYTKERTIDLASAERMPGDSEEGIGFGRRAWIRFFEGLGRIAYSSADPIIALYGGNQRRQVRDGAAPARTRVIPNGVDVDRFRWMRAQRPAEPPPVLGFLGRVVPIKDVKTFIRAMKAIAARRPDVEGWIVGPVSEDEGYAAECSRLAATLGLGGRLKFAGFQPPEEILPRLGLLVLTSISEALPLVVLEAFASGLPVLATDVGACRELVQGRTGEDAALGAAGAVVPIGDTEATAREALGLLCDPARWRAAQRAAIRRVEAYYTFGQMIGEYRRIYREAGAWPA